MKVKTYRKPFSERGIIFSPGAGYYPPQEGFFLFFDPLVAQATNGFYKIKFGAEEHGRSSFFVWAGRDVLPKFKQEEGYIYLPPVGQGLQIIKSEKGALVLRQGSFYYFNFYIRAGYRGHSEICVLNKEVIYYHWYYYHSERGKLGISQGALVFTKTPEITFQFKRTGRLYGTPSEGILRIKILSEDEVEVEELPPLDVMEILL